MELRNYNLYFFFIILIGISVLVFFVIKPFLVPLLIAAILANLFDFIYKRILSVLGKRGISSFLACFSIALIIVVPLIVVSTLVVNEIQNIISKLVENPESIRNIISDFENRLRSIRFLNMVDIGKIINQDSVIAAAKNLSQNALKILQSTYKGLAHFIFVTFIMFFTLFYLFIDGKKLIKKIMELSPIRDSYENTLIQKFVSISRATIKGTSLISIMQGTLGGILFFLTGVPSPVLLGILMTISSVIPSIGSGLVWAPVGIIMLIAGNTVQGLVILIIGALVISTVDNIVRPRLVGRDTQLHPLMILFSTLGGIALFGISGFIVGPIIMSLFVALWEIYYLEFKNQLERYNK